MQRDRRQTSVCRRLRRATPRHNAGPLAAWLRAANPRQAFLGPPNREQERELLLLSVRAWVLKVRPRQLGGVQQYVAVVLLPVRAVGPHGWLIPGATRSQRFLIVPEPSA